MDTIQKLAKFDLGGEIYHSDGEGHVQVEQRPVNLVDPFEPPQVLLGQVEQKGLWPEFFEMAKTKEDDWLLRISRHFSNAENYTTTCFVEFLSLLSSRDALIVFIQDSPEWTWDEKRVSLIDVVIDKAMQIVHSFPHDSSDYEIDLSILNGVISKLEAKRAQAKQT